MQIELARKHKSSSIWNLDGYEIALPYKNIQEVEHFLKKLEELVLSKSDLSSLVEKRNKIIILRVLSHFYSGTEIGKQYLKHHIDVLTRENVHFYKRDLYYHLFGKGEKISISQITNDTNVLEFFSCFNELRKQSQLEILDIRGCLQSKSTFTHISDKIPPITILRYCYNAYHYLFVEYIKYFCKVYTDKLEIVYYWKLLADIFGKKQPIDIKKNNKTNDTNLLKNEIQELVNEEYLYQCAHLVETNINRMNLNEECWTLFFLIGPVLHVRSFDFLKIQEPNIRREIKIYYKEDKLNYNRRVEGVGSYLTQLAKCVNFLHENNPSIRHFAQIGFDDINALKRYLEDVSKTYHNKNLAIGTIASIISLFKTITDFLIENAVDKNQMGLKVSYPIPQYNYFNDVEVTNVRGMQKPTDLIPDVVMDQLVLHKHELREDYELIFDIFNETGMRAKEALLLEENCLDGEKNELYYVQYKNEGSRRRRSYPDRKLVIISDSLYIAIQNHAIKTADIRKKLNVPFIFLKEKSSISGTMPSSDGITNAINTIIKRHNIKDYDGSIWDFGCRQMRKYVASVAINNGASELEIQTLFGHVNPDTTRNFYEEIERIKLAEMNSMFFEEQFEVHVGKENLDKFSESERRALYVDFRLNYRDVELGLCTRHFSEKPCSKISGKISCAACPKCSTGKKYLPKWEALGLSQQKLVNDLKQNYIKESIVDYEEFVEYKREIYFLKCYEDAISKILLREDRN